MENENQVTFWDQVRGVASDAWESFSESATESIGEWAKGILDGGDAGSNTLTTQGGQVARSNANVSSDSSVPPANGAPMPIIFGMDKTTAIAVGGFTVLALLLLRKG